MRLAQEISYKLPSVMGSVQMWGLLVLFGWMGIASATLTREMVGELTIYPSGLGIVWSSEKHKCEFIKAGKYIQKNIIPTRFQIYKDTAFIVTPRYRCGVPFTLGSVCLRDMDHCNPGFKPFPSWSFNAEENVEGIQNAVDLFIDCKDILWVLDVGIVNTLEKPVKKASPRVFGICPASGKVVRTVNLGALVCAQSRLQYLQVENADDGHTYLYVSDAGTRSILAWDVSLCRGFRIVLPRVVQTGAARRDVLYISLLHPSCGSAILYFTYLSGSRMFMIRTKDIREGISQGSVIYVGTKPGLMVILGTDNGMTLFFRIKGENDIYMWNANTKFSPENFVLGQRGEDCRMATHVTSGYKRLMWVLDSNFQDYIQGTVGCVGASARLKPLIKFCDE